MDGGEESPTSLYLELADRFQSLEASQNNIKEQFNVLLQEKTYKDKIENFKEKEMASDSRYRKSFHVCSFAPGAYFSASPYKRVLDYMGHAVHVSRAGSGEIIYWNKAAEKLFGYKECEVIGQRVFELLFDEEYLQSAGDIIERWSCGESWSGQLILKKKSGQIFKAMVSKSPLYEDGELIGAITVSSDANIFNNKNLEYSRTLHDHANDQPKVRGINWKKIQWHPQPQIASVPQLASSVSELASKVLSCKRGDAAFSFSKTTRESEEAEVESQGMKADRPPRAPPAKPIFNLSIGNSRTKGESSEQDESTFDFAQPSKIAAKVISKLHIGGISKKFMDENMQQNGSDDASKIQDVENEPCSPRVRMVNIANIDANNCEDNAMTGACYAVERKHLNMHVNSSDTTDNSCIGAYCVNQFPSSILQLDERVCVPNVPNMKSKDVGDASPRQPDSQKFPSSDGSDGNGCGSTSSRDDSESLMVADCEIRWEDLQLREQIGQGSFAVVYRGTWNGSDVAVKVYCGNQYSEGALLDYKKEIDIMRRLRHPNVLLLMGAVCSREKLAMVTEYLPRGSLFKTLHKNNQSLDIRRRLRMAIDVARGMNYLHRRNPPIVHRDLKSSNLLVDKSWTVKVGDFGLSKLKNATFLTAKSGRGTPQWMAPEVLRNEPSTEKSDVFSFGVILWELMTECIPWSNLNSLQVVGVVGFMDRRLEIPKSVDPRISSIISDCWQSNLENRPSFEDIIYKMTDLVHAGAGVTKTTSTP